MALTDIHKFPLKDYMGQLNTKWLVSHIVDVPSQCINIKNKEICEFVRKGWRTVCAASWGVISTLVFLVEKTHRGVGDKEEIMHA